MKLIYGHDTKQTPATKSYSNCMLNHLIIFQNVSENNTSARARTHTHTHMKVISKLCGPCMLVTNQSENYQIHVCGIVLLGQQDLGVYGGLCG